MSTAEVIVLRILPSKPVIPSDFLAAISSININVYDLSLQDNISGGGTLIGSAKGVLPSTTDKFTVVTRDNKSTFDQAIIIHSLLDGTTTSIATALVLLDRPPGNHEYPTNNAFDLRLEVTGTQGQEVAVPLEYNIAGTQTPIITKVVDTSPPPSWQHIYKLPAACFVFIPSASVLSASTSDVGIVKQNSTGSPPDFRSLTSAIDKVLTKEDTPLKNRSSPLTAAESLHIASELVWNRTLHPPPTPPDSGTLAKWYTLGPGVDIDQLNEDQQKQDQRRQRFEAELHAYQATQFADSRQLASFVFSASAAVDCERRSAAASKASFTFPIKSTVKSSTSVSVASLVITGSAGSTTLSQFAVPAAFFYAISISFTPDLPSEFRYNAALTTLEDRLVKELQAAVDSSVVSETESFIVETGSINFHQAARRLVALGGAETSLIPIEATLPLPDGIPSFESIITDWLGYQDVSAQIIPKFWEGSNGEIQKSSEPYVSMLLWVITRGSVDLIKAILKSNPPQGLGITSIDALVAVTDQKWRQFFGAEGVDPTVLQQHPDLIPAFLMLPDLQQSVQAWISHLQRFFLVTQSGVKGPVAQATQASTFDTPSEDLLSLFIKKYNATTNSSGAFSLANALDTSLVDAAVGSIFPAPTQERERECLHHMVEVLSDLFRLTTFSSPDMQFSLMEALYSRGIISKEQASDLGSSQLRNALRGTIGYSRAHDIWLQARKLLNLSTDEDTTQNETLFKPINPDGHLSNCLPAEYLSPIGKISYLQDVLSQKPSSETLLSLLSTRRGALDMLQVSKENLSMEIPTIDLVNESLEALAAHPNTSIGQIYNTTPDLILNSPRALKALPANSSPAFLIKNRSAYDNLKTSFDAPSLPYSQFLDVNRTYLRQIGTTRSQVMRTFRKESTNFPIGALDPNKPPEVPSDFQSYRWRLPVDFDVALEHLCISKEEYNMIYSGRLLTESQIQVMYGFTSEHKASMIRRLLPRTILSTDPGFQCFPSDTKASDWEKDKWYNVGNLVRYNGRLYAARQSHQSQATWTPDVPIPALWHTPTPCGVTAWLVQTHYIVGSLVTFQGKTYQCILEHTSDSPDWTPPNTPVLWQLSNSGDGEPGTQHPGGGEPGTEHPGGGEPGTEHPGDGEPGTEHPGDGEPGSETPDGDDNGGWITAVSNLDQFLRRTGLSYCEFLEFVDSEFIKVKRRSEVGELYPKCEPCCLSKIEITFEGESKIIALRKSIIFIRLWRSLQCCWKRCISIKSLARICKTLSLFVDVAGTVNSDFIRQLESLLAMTQRFGLPLEGILLRLYTRPLTLDQRDEISKKIIDCLERMLVKEKFCVSRGHTLKKILASNTDLIARLAGFLYTDHWYDLPTNTIRFLEVLCHIYGSKFDVGDLVLTFTADNHLAGNDPFPLQDPNESKVNPLELPEDSEFDLWSLRKRLLDVCMDAEAVQSWNWQRILRSLHHLGFTDTTSITEMAEHFFPSVLESTGHSVSSEKRRFNYALATTDASMWSPPNDGPFSYTGTHLSFQLPLKDKEVLRLLSEIRPLAADEQDAIRNLYFAPRSMLAPFAAIFENFNHAVLYLVQSDTDEARWHFFRQQFVLFFSRCEIIAQHLAQHVVQLTNLRPYCPDDKELAWKILRSLVADENRPSGAPSNWEPPSQTPSPWSPPSNFTWERYISGGAFSAILGLVGSGLVQELYVYEGDQKRLVWRETSSNLDVFGDCARNDWNTPVPTILPSMATPPNLLNNRYVTIRNGIAIRDTDDKLVGGIERFEAKWSGSLLVECPGKYSFLASQPSHRGADSANRDCNFYWELSLKQGQKVWEVMKYDPNAREGAQLENCDPVWLKRGRWEVDLRFWQAEPTFGDPGYTNPRVRAAHSGFRLQYCGPDTNNDLVVVPHKVLFPPSKNGTLASDVADSRVTAGSAAHEFLQRQYYSTFRDIRRTYQRAFKALLFCMKFGLSGVPEKQNDGLSELEYLINNPVAFAGVSYYDENNTKKYLTHTAELNFNLLPVMDPYDSPPPEVDSRVAPTQQRQAALFDWFERMFQYTILRKRIRRLCRTKPLWSMFYEAKTQNSSSAAQLLLHLGIDVSNSPVALRYLTMKATLSPDNPDPAVSNPSTLKTSNLIDERWSYRVWKAGKWIEQVQRAFYVSRMEAATPALWSASEGAALGGSSNPLVNFTLEKFVYDNMIATDYRPKIPRGWKDLTKLNNGLRERARKALIAYLCSQHRVSLNGYQLGSYAQNSEDLSNLLLINVDCGVEETSSRICDAIQATQSLVQRARVSLEPKVAIMPKFLCNWLKIYETFCEWQAHKKRELYKENWIQFHELERASKSEGFHLLENELRRNTHNFPLPGASKWWDLEGPTPTLDPLLAIQSREAAKIEDISSEPNEGLSMMAVPEADGRPSLVTNPQPSRKPTELQQSAHSEVSASRARPSHDSTLTDVATPESGAIASFPAEISSLPLWVQCAIRMGFRFIRIAAAGPAPAIPFPPAWCGNEGEGESGCCGLDVRPFTMDEYWFWLTDGSFFKTIHDKQNADIGSKDRLDPNSSWDKDEQLPTLLQWPEKPLVYLYWTRVREGRFDPPQRSEEGVEVNSKSLAGSPLKFMKRKDDSLTFSITTAAARPGYPKPESKPADVTTGFRYDMADDKAVVVPQLAEDASQALKKYPAGLTSFPYFIYFRPGAPLVPVSKYGVALMVGSALRARCCYETALRWCEVAYNPLLGDNKWEHCNRPSTANIHARVASTSNDVATHETGNSSGASSPGPCCSQQSKDVENARQRAVTLLYLEILLDWANSLAAKQGVERTRQAQVILSCLDRVLGQLPDTIQSTESSQTTCMTVGSFVPQSAALNPRLLSIYDNLSYKKSQLYEIMSQSHRPSCCPPGPSFPLDNSCSGWSCPTSGLYYRFTSLLPKAIEATTMVRSLGSSLLGAFEKGDAEYLSTLRAGQERQIQSFTLDVRQSQWRESDWQLQALEKQMQGAQTRLKHLNDLIAHGLNSNERSYQISNDASMDFRDTSTTSDTIAQTTGSTPDMWVGIAGFAGTPLQFQQIPVGVKLAHGFATGARILNTLAERFVSQGGRNLNDAQWDRREEEWRHQVDVVSIEIEQIKRQMLAAKRRSAISLGDLNIHRRQMEQSDEVQAFLRDKFTKHDLYIFLQGETAALYRQAYELATSYAKDALSSFLHERGDYIMPRTVNQTSAVGSLVESLEQQNWNSLREGLLAGERLEFSLRMLERGYMIANAREYELTKHVSLRTTFPLQYLLLKMTGKTTITIPESLLDLEYPGHYMRRIKSVSLTIPCVTGPYVGVRCVLKLVSSSTRVSPALHHTKACCHPDSSCCSCTDTDGYAPSPCDPRIVRSYYHNMRPELQTSSMIATSSGMTDSGMFETNLRQDERYLPFELCGLVDSTWTIELPPEHNQFDLSSLTDVIVNINYTAREGGEALRAAAWEVAMTRLPDDGFRYIDIRQEMGDSWYRCFNEPLLGGRKHHPNRNHNDHNDSDSDSDQQHKHKLLQRRSHRPYKPGPRPLSNSRDRNIHHSHQHHRSRPHFTHKLYPYRLVLNLSRSSFPFISPSRLIHSEGVIMVTKIDIFIEGYLPASHRRHIDCKCKSQKSCSCGSKSRDCTSGERCGEGEGLAHIDLAYLPAPHCSCCPPEHQDVPCVVRCERKEELWHGVVELDGESSHSRHLDKSTHNHSVHATKEGGFSDGRGLPIGVGSQLHHSSPISDVRLNIGTLCFPIGVRAEGQKVAIHHPTHSRRGCPKCGDLCTCHDEKEHQRRRGRSQSRSSSACSRSNSSSDAHGRHADPHRPRSRSRSHSHSHSRSESRRRSPHRKPEDSGHGGTHHNRSRNHRRSCSSTRRRRTHHPPEDSSVVIRNVFLVVSYQVDGLKGKVSCSSGHKRSGGMMKRDSIRSDASGGHSSDD